jgi:hypothetical protein
LKSIRIPDRNHNLSYAELLRITQPSRCNAQGFGAWGIQSNHREVRSRIVADRPRWELPPVHQRNQNPACIMDDVTVGKNETVGRKNES